MSVARVAGKPDRSRACPPGLIFSRYALSGNRHPACGFSNERILIIYGAGHLAWLRRNFSSDPTLQLRKLAEFANYEGVSR